jgi:hypothetical protein
MEMNILKIAWLGFFFGVFVGSLAQLCDNHSQTPLKG